MVMHRLVKIAIEVNAETQTGMGCREMKQKKIESICLWEKEEEEQEERDQEERDQEEMPVSESC